MSERNIGTHLILDAWQCSKELLDDTEKVRQALIQAVKEGDGTLIHIFVHQFSPQGVTATATLAESHITVHTWPEYGYFAADLFFCGSGKPRRAMKCLQKALQAGKIRIQEVKRGFIEANKPAEEPLPVHEQV